ncbi:MAG: DEAD/DEAH box helicase [Alistipes sp.]|nr:DEAD/DEAH box helicase [Alistipes sp.]
MNNLEDFRALGLSDDILDAIARKGFETPSAIQALTIPHLLSTDKDIIAQAQTGTGKTAAFGLPLIQMLEARRTIPQALVLVPTRELALQVTGEIQSFNTGELAIAPIYGGASIEEQLRRLKKGVDIVVGTPGRILDHIRRRTLNLSEVEFLVLDEADEMLNMGFIEDIEAIMQEMNESKRVLLFSATMPDRIAALARKYMVEPDLLKVEARNITTDLTNQIYFEVREGDKFDALTRIIDVEPEFYGIVFSRTRVGTDEITTKLIERGYSAEGLHGDISQGQREKTLGKFKKRVTNILVATDVAARGIDVDNLTHVINYSLPQDSDSYVHRIGRTGRAGRQGTAITFISPSEMRKFGFLKREIKVDIKLEKLPTPADVIATKRNKIKEDLYGIVESENYLECSAMAAEILELYSPEVALGALLRLAFKNELSESNYPEIRSINVDRKGKTRLFIAIGGKDGYDPRRIVKMLKSECDLRDHDIDDIKVMEDFTFVTVPFEASARVVKALNMRSGGRPIAEVAKEERGGFGGGSARGERGDRPARGDRPSRGEKPSWGDRPTRNKKNFEKPFGKSFEKPERDEKSFDKPANGDFENSFEKPAKKRKKEDTAWDVPMNNDWPGESAAAGSAGGFSSDGWTGKLPEGVPDDWFAPYVDKPAGKSSGKSAGKSVSKSAAGKFSGEATAGKSFGKSAGSWSGEKSGMGSTNGWSGEKSPKSSRRASATSDPFGFDKPRYSEKTGAGRPGVKAAGGRDEDRSGAKPGAKFGEKSVSKSGFSKSGGAKFGAKSSFPKSGGSKFGAKSGGKPYAKSGSKPAAEKTSRRERKEARGRW